MSIWPKRNGPRWRGCRGRSRSICISPIARKSAGIAGATPGRPTAASACPPISAPAPRDRNGGAGDRAAGADHPHRLWRGSPNAISPTDFVRLIDTLTLNFRLARPVLSLELDPRSLAPQWFTAIRGIGVIKASLGVQTFDPRVQAAIGRVQPEADIARAMDGLRGAGVDSINFDLMYGLPYQDEAVLAQTLDTAVAMAPDRVALFGYAHVPHVVPRQRRIDVAALPGQRTRFAMAAQGSAHLRGRAMTPSVSITLPGRRTIWPRRGAMARCGAISRALPTIPQAR
jgi:hypothetical protein